MEVQHTHTHGDMIHIYTWRLALDAHTPRDMIIIHTWRHDIHMDT